MRKARYFGALWMCILAALAARPLFADDFFTLTPCRSLDTRVTHQTLIGTTSQLFTLAGTCGIPTTATAVSLNTTLVSATGPVDLGIVPGNFQPTGTNVVSANAASNRSTMAGQVVVGLAQDGSKTVRVGASFPSGGQADLLLDVNGYFLPTMTSDCPYSGCRALGHTSMSLGTNPYTEDISQAANGVTLTGPTLAWTVIEGACPNIEGNLNGSVSFNAILRAQLTVQPYPLTTAAVGARYEVQLTVDGVEHGWYLHRLRGEYPQADVFGGIAQDLAPGPHTFALQARLLDAGTMTVENMFIDAFGQQNTLPSDKLVQGPGGNYQTATFTTITGVSQFSVAAAVDIVLDGYFQVDVGAPGNQLAIAPFLDGVQQNPVTYVGIPPNLSDGINMLFVLPNVPAGTHSLSLRAITNNSLTTLSNREIEWVAFPASTYFAFASATDTIAVQSNTSQAQPSTLSLEHDCGLWSKLLEATIPADTVDYPLWNVIYEGYVHFPGTAADYTGPVTYAQLFFASGYPDGKGTDGGGRTIQIPLANGGTGSPYPDGAYLFGDTGGFSQGQPETIQLWARKVNTACDGAFHNGQQGAFNLSDRYLWARIVPFGGACIFQ